MRNTLIVILLFTCFALFGQGTNVMHTTHRAISTGGGESVTNMLYNGDFTEDTVQWELGYGNALLAYSSNSIYFDNSATSQLIQYADSMVNNILADDSVQFRVNCSGFSTARTAITIRDYPQTETFSTGVSFNNGWTEINHRIPDYYTGDGGIQFYILDYEDFTIEEVQIILLER